MIHGDIRTRIVSGLSANLIAQSINILIQIAGIPFLLHYWSVELYGIWLLLFSVPSYLGMSDMGLGTVASIEIGMNIAKGDYIKAQKIFQTAFRFVVFLGLFICLLFSLSLWIFPYQKWLQVESLLPEDFRITMLLLTSYVLGAIFLSLPSGLYRAIGLYGRGQIIASSFKLLEFLSLLVIVFKGGGVIAAAGVYALVRLVNILVVLLDLYIKSPWMRLHRGTLNIGELKRMVKPSLSMSAVNMGQALITQGYVIIAGSTLGPVGVVVFSTTRTLCNFARQMIGIVNLSIAPEYAFSLGEGNLDLARSLHARSAQINLLLSLCAVLMLKCLGPFILNYWTQGKVEVQEPFFTLYLTYVLINSLWWGSWNMLLSCNKHINITKYYLLINTCSLFAAYFSSTVFHLHALSMCLLLADTLMSIIVLRESFKVLGQPASDFLKSLADFTKIFKIAKA